LLLLGATRRHDAAIDTQSLVGKPFDDAGAGNDFHLGLGQRLALLLRQQRGDLVGALLEQGCGTAHDGAALMGRHLAPDLKALVGRRQGAVQVGNIGMGHTANHLAACRVAHINFLAAGSVLPLTVDQKLGIRICSAHRMTHRCRPPLSPCRLTRPGVTNVQGLPDKF
jgi:hypothetical protein